MTTSSLAQLLAAWRAAARRWEAAAEHDPTSPLAIQVVHAWLAYQEAAMPTAADEFVLVTDDSLRYVAASSRVTSVLGYAIHELIGRRITDIAAPEVRDRTGEEWARFVDAGVQEGDFVLLAVDGSPVRLRFQAQANHPVAGFHVSRLRPLDPAPPAAPERELELATQAGGT